MRRSQRAVVARRQRVALVPSPTGFDPDRWEQGKAILVGEELSRLAPREELSEGDKFVHDVPLDKEFSILASETAQYRVLLQFALPKDDHVLYTMPRLGLHMALKGSLLKGALVAEELFDRLSHLHECSADEEFMTKERVAREEVEKKVVTLEAERSHEEASWHRELDAKERMISGYTLQHTKHAALIEKLHGDVATLKEDVDHLKWEIIERDGPLSSLGAEVRAEKQRREEAQESARLELLAVEGLRKDLSQEQSAHQASRAEIQDLEARLACLDSQEYRAWVVEEYRHSSLGKAEVALSWKAGVDHLTSLISHESRPFSDRLYPPQVACCLDFLKELEARGGGTLLTLDEGDKDDESGADQEEAGSSALLSNAAESAADPRGDLSSPTPDPDRER